MSEKPEGVNVNNFFNSLGISLTSLLEPNAQGPVGMVTDAEEAKRLAATEAKRLAEKAVASAKYAILKEARRIADAKAAEEAKTKRLAEEAAAAKAAKAAKPGAAAKAAEEAAAAKAAEEAAAAKAAKEAAAAKAAKAAEEAETKRIADAEEEEKADDANGQAKAKPGTAEKVEDEDDKEEEKAEEEADAKAKRLSTNDLTLQLDDCNTKLRTLLGNTYKWMIDKWVILNITKLIELINDSRGSSTDGNDSEEEKVDPSTDGNESEEDESVGEDIGGAPPTIETQIQILINVLKCVIDYFTEKKTETNKINILIELKTALTTALNKLDIAELLEILTTKENNIREFSFDLVDDTGITLDDCLEIKTELENCKNEKDQLLIRIAQTIRGATPVPNNTDAQGANAPEQGANAPEQGANAPEQGANAPEQGANAPEQGADAPEQGQRAVPMVPTQAEVLAEIAQLKTDLNKCLEEKRLLEADMARLPAEPGQRADAPAEAPAEIIRLNADLNKCLEEKRLLEADMARLTAEQAVAQAEIIRLNADLNKCSEEKRLLEENTRLTAEQAEAQALAQAVAQAEIAQLKFDLNKCSEEKRLLEAELNALKQKNTETQTGPETTSTGTSPINQDSNPDPGTSTNNRSENDQTHRSQRDQELNSNEQKKHARIVMNVTTNMGNQKQTETHYFK
jgi:hypothetical protein